MPNKLETLVQHSEKKLEDVRNSLAGNECDGRGRSTAAGRGYNTERLAGAVLGVDGNFIAYTDRSWYDTFALNENVSPRVECKSCVYRYPSGGYGRFRIWQQHHHTLLGWDLRTPDERVYLYFFVVYEVENGIEREVGKVVAPVNLVDKVLDKWKERTHQTMGTRHVRDISWHLLLKRLGVSEHELRAEQIVDLTHQTEPDTYGTLR